MRLTFLLLVLINLAVFVWGAGYLTGRDPGREPERLATEQNADKLHILPGNVPMLCHYIDGLDAAQLVQLRETFASLRDVAISSTDQPGPTSYWVAISNLDSAELAARKQSELRGFNVNDAQVLADPKLGPFVVLIANLPTDAAAQKLLADLTARGIRSARVIAHEAAPATPRVSLRWPESAGHQRLETLESFLASQPARDALHHDTCPSSSGK